MRRALIITSLLFTIHIFWGPLVLGQTADDIPGLKHYDSQIFFEENLGQFSPEIHFQTFVDHAQYRFLSHGPSYALVRELEKPSSGVKPPKYENYRWFDEREAEFESLVYNLKFVRSSPMARIRGRKPMPGEINYFMGNDSSKWVRGASRFQELWYEDLYPGIDLRYYGTREQAVKYDLIVRPGHNSDRIHMKLEGTKGFEINSAGELEVLTQWGIIKDAAPYAYQYIDGQEIEVVVKYKRIDRSTVGFEVLGFTDSRYPLVIDPITLNWASFLHSSGSDDYVMATVLDNDDFVYVTGYTKSLTFPTTPGVYQDVYGGGIDAYVAKMNPLGTSLVYATYIGGLDWELAYGIGLDANKQVYIAGFLRSSDYPTTHNSFQPVSGGGLVEGFVSCINSSGNNLVYSTYLGGSDRDYVYDMRVNPAGEAFLTGYSLSTDYPITSGVLQSTMAGNGDAFLTKLSADGTSVLQSTYLGGSNYDIANGMHLQSNGEVMVVGNTGSWDFPTSTGAIQTSLVNVPGYTAEDAFVSKISADFSTVQYSTYLGGSDTDGAYCVTTNASGEAFVSGVTYSNDLPVSPGAFQHYGNTLLGSGDAFVSRISADGSQLLYQTYLGGSAIDFGKSIVVNEDDEAYVLGATRSADFPVSATSKSFNNMYDLYVAVISPDGSSAPQAAYYGGVYNDYPRSSGSMYLRGNNQLTIAATTHSGDMPMTSGSYQSTKTNGVSDTPWIGSVEINIVLPATLLSFSAEWTSEKQAVSLNWEALEDPSVVAYTVEVIRPGQEWTSLEEQIRYGAGDVQQYTFLDKKAMQWVGESMYYRLGYEGQNGERYYSAMQRVEIPHFGEEPFRLFPNPATDRVNLQWLGRETDLLKWEVLDLCGRKLAVSEQNQLSGTFRQNHQLDLHFLTAGIYLIRLTDENGSSQTQKLLIE